MRKKQGARRAGSAPSIMSRMSLSEGIFSTPNKLWQFERPWPFSSARWKERKEGNCSGFLELERFCDADGARGSLIFGLVETAGG
jgi:hypothetical protein